MPVNPMHAHRKSLRLIPLALALALTACTSDELMLQNKVDYRSESDNLNKNPLEVPPDLSAPSATSTYGLNSRAQASAREIAARTPNTSGAQAVTPEVGGAYLERAGGQRWLVVKKPPEKVWNELREFWLGQGFLLTVDNPTSGVMETDWQENHANLPPDIMTSILNKVVARFVTTGEKDSFRTRIEPGREKGTTEIYISHRGMVEVLRDGSAELKFGGADAGDYSTMWTPRPNDPGLEAEMLALALQQLGYDKSDAKAIVNPAAPVVERARLDNAKGSKVLVVDDSFDRAWRRVGLAVERTGFVIYDRDRSQGNYLIRQAEIDIGKEQSSSWADSLAFWRSKDSKEKAKMPEYLLKVAAAGNGTQVSLAPQAGTAANADLEQKLLNALYLQLK
ncbi:outer membrane protein assembly factor BamC [Chitinilyticum litopenaei]|uniref:outer membrane protein assembly factor BamC n=1 Tax=Chitinilyticum litopenaei TaxID=1121276 RepID=UPI000688A5C6|nr:outer membrane protein assembly factor BamC [Chitinilyticum litopenaei]